MFVTLTLPRRARNATRLVTGANTTTRSTPAPIARSASVTIPRARLRIRWKVAPKS